MTNHLLQIQIKCFPHPGKKPPTKCFNFISSSTKLLKCLPYSKKKFSYLISSLCLSTVTVSSMNPFKQLSGSMFREKSTPHEKAKRIQRYNSVVSNLVFFHLWKQHFMVQNRCQNGATEALDFKVKVMIVIV